MQFVHSVLFAGSTYFQQTRDCKCVLVCFPLSQSKHYPKKKTKNFTKHLSTFACYYNNARICHLFTTTWRFLRLHFSFCAFNVSLLAWLSFGFIVFIVAIVKDTDSMGVIVDSFSCEPYCTRLSCLRRNGHVSSGSEFVLLVSFFKYLFAFKICSGKWTVLCSKYLEIVGQNKIKVKFMSA